MWISSFFAWLLPCDIMADNLSHVISTDRTKIFSQLNSTLLCVCNTFSLSIPSLVDSWFCGYYRQSHIKHVSVHISLIDIYFQISAQKLTSCLTQWLYLFKTLFWHLHMAFYNRYSSSATAEYSISLFSTHMMRTHQFFILLKTAILTV